MIVISLILVIAAAVSLFIGLFVVTETLTFIWGAIVLCLVSLLLLWLGTRQRKGASPSAPSAPVYGGAARAGGSAAPARTAASDDLDDLTSPEGGAVVRKATARDRAATRVAAGSSRADDTVTVEETRPSPAEQTPVGAATADVDDADEVVESAEATSAAAATPVTKGTRKSTARSTAKKATKATARKTTKKATKKSTARKSAKKATAKKATAKKATAKKATAATTGPEARARLAQIAGVGPAKQDALLGQFGSLEGIRDASVDDIVANVRGFGEALATRVKNELS